MKFRKQQITTRDIANGYKENEDKGVVGYDGNLDIRPSYHREFIYDDIDCESVIDSVMKGYPLNVLNWADNSDGKYEVLDGQQRIISICRFIEGKFSIFPPGGNEPLFFQELTKAEQGRILDYKLDVCIFQGSEQEKMDCYRTINSGRKSSDKEELNAIKHLSQTGGDVLSRRAS